MEKKICVWSVMVAQGGFTRLVFQPLCMMEIGTVVTTNTHSPNLYLKMWTNCSSHVISFKLSLCMKEIA